MVPDWMLKRPLLVAVGVALMAQALCAFSWGAGLDPATAHLGELADLVAARNAPLGVCALGWGILIVSADRGCPPTGVQYASIVLFFGSLLPVFSSLWSVPEGFGLIERVLGL